MRKRAVEDVRPAAAVRRKKDRRPLAVEAATLASRVDDLEIGYARLIVRLRVVLRLLGVTDESLKEAEDEATTS